MVESGEAVSGVLVTDCVGDVGVCAVFETPDSSRSDEAARESTLR